MNRLEREAFDALVASRAKESELFTTLDSNVTALIEREALLVGLLRECYPHVERATVKLIDLGIQSHDEQSLLRSIEQAIK